MAKANSATTGEPASLQDTTTGAATNNQPNPEALQKTAKPQAKKPSEITYSVAELAGAARARFGVLPEVVTTAMRVANKAKATLPEAKQIIEQFTKREVK